jgi:drug/metabolite transporter (DMT)-like permease
VSATPAPAAASPPARFDAADFAQLGICSLIWGTTWFAITHQLGVVAPVISVIYRFGLAAALLFVICLATGRKIALSPQQHLGALGQGVFTFGVNYAFVYLAEERLASAVVAVLFAGLAFLNLILFRLVLRQKASGAAWAGAALGVAGVAVLSWSELLRADMGTRAAIGLAYGFTAVIGAAIGNLFAWRAQKLGAEIFACTAWGMAYGTAMLAVWALATGEAWRFEWSVGYVGSLLYLSLFGSVIAFVLYFTLARRRGYTLASYISAVTPPIAMAVSAVFEHAKWGLAALAGVALVMLGQVLLIRAPKG